MTSFLQKVAYEAEGSSSAAPAVPSFLFSGDGTWGDIPFGTPVAHEFTISEANGDADLIVTGISFDPVGILEHDAVLPWTIEAGTSETFNITALAEELGAFEIALDFESNGEIVTLFLTGTVTQAEMNVKGNSISIVDGDSGASVGDHTDFGITDVGVVVDRIFTIENLGTAVLNITTPITVPAGFSCTVQPSNTIAPSGSTTFTVRALAASKATFTGQISIVSDDADENPYNFTISYQAIQAEMSILGNSLVIPHGDITPSTGDFTDYGNTLVLSTVTKTFSVRNASDANDPGTDDLSNVSVSAPSGFTVVDQPDSTISPNTSSTFQIRCDAATEQVYSGVVTVTADGGFSRTFTITCNSDLPEIRVTGNSVTITDGDASPQAGDFTDYGDVEYAVTLSKSFIIYNDGLVDLIIPSFTTPDGFTRTTAASITIVAGGNHTHTVRFDAVYHASAPNSIFSGNIVIPNNSHNPSFTFAIAAELWLLYTNWPNNEAAPIASPKALEIGNMTAVQTDGNFGVSSNKLDFIVQTTPVTGDLGIRNTTAIAAVTGSARVVAAKINFATTAAISAFGWFLTTAMTTFRSIISFSGAQVLNSAGGSGQGTLTITTATEYPGASAWLADRFLNFVKIGSFWRMLFMHQSTDASMYPAFTNNTSVGNLDNLRAKALDETLFAPAVNITGSISAGQTWTISGDHEVQFTLTTRPSAGVETYKFRYQDASNYWHIEINSAGLITLYETTTALGTVSKASGGAVTSGTIIRILSIGKVITVYTPTASPFTYSSAFNFVTSTACELTSHGTGGVISNVIAYPVFRRSQNGLGSELVVNGTFAADTNWTKGTGWTISSGAAHKVTGTASNLSQASILVVNEYFELSFTVSNYVAGTLSPRLGNNGTMAPVSANGTYTYRGICDVSTPSVLFVADNLFVGDLDNVSCKAFLWSADAVATALDALLSA